MFQVNDLHRYPFSDWLWLKVLRQAVRLGQNVTHGNTRRPNQIGLTGYYFLALILFGLESFTKFY